MDYERDDDPYVYESIVPRGNTARRRKLQEPAPQPVVNPITALISSGIKPTPIQEVKEEAPRKPILPPVDFGARLFAGLGEDVMLGLSGSDHDDVRSPRRGRRRAYTDINDLLVNDMMNGAEDPNNRVNKE